MPAPLVYSQTMPPPAVGVEIGPPYEPPSAVLAWASVGQDAALVVAAAVVGTAAVVAVLAGAVVAEEAEEVEEVVGLLLPDPQPANSKPTVRAPATRTSRLYTATTLRPCPTSHK